MAATTTDERRGAPFWASPRVRRFALAVAGPAAIVLAVLLVLHNYVARAYITDQHGDILEAWLPFYCFQGKVLAAGHIPSFNPYALAGTPFAGDPQSGWMYLPAMLLFTALPCAVAIRWFLVLQPILAGLGAYWFLRAERAGRAAATAAGLVMALLMADSHLGLELPFAGAFAWTMLTLAAAARFVHAERWSRRILWLVLTAIGWGQIAAAHLSHGLVVGTILLGIYLIYRLGADALAGRRGWAEAVGVLAVTGVVLLLANMAYLWPRVAYLSESTLHLGYANLNVLAGQVSGHPFTPVTKPQSLWIGSTWIFGLASAPGAYLGAITCALSFAGLWSKRHRGLAIALIVFAVGSWTVSLHGLAVRIYPHIRGLPFADFYIHAPVRFRDGAVLVLPLLAGLGIQAWLDAGPWRGRSAWRDRALMLLPGLVFWWVLPGVVQRPHAYPTIFLVGTVAAAVVLLITAWRPSLAWIVPALLLVELTGNGIAGARAGSPKTGSPWGQSLYPHVVAADYMREGAIARTIGASGDWRFITLAPKGQAKAGRAKLLRVRSGWAALGNQRSMLFGLQDAGGYNPVQLPRYWEFVRATDQQRLTYNAAFFVAPVPASALDLLHVRWLIAPTSDGPKDPSATLVTTEGPWGLYELAHPAPRASLVTSWRVVATPGAALRAATAPSFDPSAVAVLEHEPGLALGHPPGSNPGGTASYQVDGLGGGTIDVEAGASGIVLIRNMFGPGWRATLDGRSVPLLATDFVAMGVAVGPGHHTIHVAYEDPTIGYGLVTSGVTLVVLLIVGLLALRRERRRRRGEPEPEPAAEGAVVA